MPSEPPHETGNDPAALSYLVIDDDSFACILAVESLKALGATEIATATNGQEALVQLEAAETEPDVLLVDLSMPGMGGAEFVRKAAEQKFQGAAIFVSGLEEDTLAIAESAARHQAINVLGHVKKPLTLDKLRGLLANLELSSS